MSALGFGLFVGSLITASTITSRAFKRPDKIGLPLMAAGLLAWIVTPPLIEGFLGFIVGALPLPITAALALHSKIDVLAKQKAIDAQRRASEREANQRRREAAHAAAELWPTEQTGWAYISKARMMHVPGQPQCYFMIKGTSLRIATYQVSQDFTVESDFEIDVNCITSTNVIIPPITKTRTKTVPVTKVEHKKKSPVARGLVGWSLLEPVLKSSWEISIGCG